MSTKNLLNTLNRYDSRCKGKNLLKIELGLVAKIQNISNNELNQTEKLQRKSIDELKEIARLRRIKNRDKLTKEGLIISLLKSESSDAERNYMKHFSNNTDDDDTYDGKIRGKIGDIRMILSRLGNVITDNDRNKVKRELYEIEKKKNLSDKEKEEIYDNLIELVNTLNEKEKYKHHDRDDLDYNAIRYIENLFNDDNDNVDDYYKPILFEK